jgi:hypothetical protein
MNDSLNNDSSSFNFNQPCYDYTTLDDFMIAVSSKDTNERLEIYSRLEDYLKNEKNNLYCVDLGICINLI